MRFPINWTFNVNFVLLSKPNASWWWNFNWLSKWSCYVICLFCLLLYCLVLELFCIVQTEEYIESTLTIQQKILIEVLTYYAVKFRTSVPLFVSSSDISTKNDSCDFLLRFYDLLFRMFRFYFNFRILRHARFYRSHHVVMLKKQPTCTVTLACFPFIKGLSHPKWFLLSRCSCLLY